MPQLAPDTMCELQHWAMDAIDLGHYAPAQQALEKNLALHPCAYTQYNLALFYVRYGLPNSAPRAFGDPFRKARRLLARVLDDPKLFEQGDLPALELSAELLYKEEKFRALSQHMDQILARAPQHAEPYNWAGIANYSLGQKQQAAGHFADSCLRLASDAPPLYPILSRIACLAHLGDTALANDLLDALVFPRAAAQPEDLYDTLLNCYLLGRTDFILENWETALEHFLPDDNLLTVCIFALHQANRRDELDDLLYGHMLRTLADHPSRQASAHNTHTKELYQQICDGGCPPVKFTPRCQPLAKFLV